MTGIQAVRGMNDLLPEDTVLWREVEARLCAVADLYGYREIRLPLVEKTELFARSIGETTDIVEKEMYTFRDLNGESLSLRPEATASCVRAGIENGLFHRQPLQRLWYIGPMFRHERPQKGRYRQFHQFGIECFGCAGPEADAEVILLGQRVFQSLRIDGVQLQINTLGSGEARARHRADLVAYLENHREVLDEDSRRRLASNPLRILDSKVESTRAVVAGAPRLLDYLDDAGRARFDRLCGHLQEIGVPFRVNPTLVRGLDYYTGVVFEFVTDRLGAQGAVCAGGRYDNLVEHVGGRPTPAAGFALGIERLVALLVLQQHAVVAAPVDAYLAMLGEPAEQAGMRLAEHLRDAGLRIEINCGGGSFRNQMKRADRSGARFALLLGDDELRDGTVTLKPLRGEGAQCAVPVAALANRLRAALSPPLS